MAIIILAGIYNKNISFRFFQDALTVSTDFAKDSGYPGKDLLG